MKAKIYSIILFAVCFLCIEGCDQDFLDKYPTTSIAAGTFWNTESDVLMGISGCYSKLKGNYLTWDRSMLETSVDNGYSKNYTGNFNVQTGTLDADNCGEYASLYSAAYSGIAACNIFLKNFKNAGLMAAKANVYEAEARFLRAFYYFELVQRWGGVVIYREVPSNIEDLKIAKSTEEEVYSFIKEDLDFAVANLTDDTYSSGHAVKTSALALQARIALFRSKWDDVIQATSSITSSHKYSLATDLRSCFIKQEGQDTCHEIIFSVKYISTADGGQRERDTGGEVTLFRESSLAVSKDLIDEYETGDLRLKKWYFSSPDGNTFTREDGYVFPGCEAIYTKYGTIKFAAVWDNQLFQDAMRNIVTGHDFVLFRLSEIYLMYAEAMVEKDGGITSDANALQYINSIRTRAGVSTFTALSRNDLRNERRREMAFEGLRYFDIQRWKIGSSLTGKIIYGSNKLTWKDQFYRWPFSRSELDINTKLVQNEGY